jgi:hypothetical protein
MIKKLKVSRKVGSQKSKVQVKSQNFKVRLGRANFIPFLILSIFILTCMGCATNSADEKPQPLLEPQVNTRFSDIPVPARFRLIDEESYAFETSGVRVALLKYQGKASPDQVLTFYKQQMAMNNWNFLNAIEYGQRQLSFDREIETCTITLLPRGSSVTITISLGPKAQIPRRPDRPVK